MSEEKDFPLRRNAVLKVDKKREIPVTISCRSNGACVVLPQSMKKMLFPKARKKGEKAERR